MTASQVVASTILTAMVWILVWVLRDEARHRKLKAALAKDRPVRNILQNQNLRKNHKKKLRITIEDFNNAHGFRVALPPEIKGRAKARNGRKISPRKKKK